MKLFTHWEHDTHKGDLRRRFFGRKSQQQAAATVARKLDIQVLAVGEYHVEPTAEAVAAFLNERMATTSYDLAEQYADEKGSTPTMEDMLK